MRGKKEVTKEINEIQIGKRNLSKIFVTLYYLFLLGL